MRTTVMLARGHLWRRLWVSTWNDAPVIVILYRSAAALAKLMPFDRYFHSGPVRGKKKSGVNSTANCVTGVELTGRPFLCARRCLSPKAWTRSIVPRDCTTDFGCLDNVVLIAEISAYIRRKLYYYTKDNLHVFI